MNVPPLPGEVAQLGTVGIIFLLVLFYGGTMWMSVAISRRKENADDYMTAGNKIGFGVSASSMTATWSCACPWYASVTAVYTYELGRASCRRGLRRRDHERRVDGKHEDHAWHCV